MLAKLPKNLASSVMLMEDASYDVHSVVIKCLPKQMRSLPMVKTILEQVEIDEDMAAFRCDKLKNVIVSFKSARSALVCVKHFNGRQWSGPSAPPVVAERLPAKEVNLQSDSQRSPVTLKDIVKLNPPPVVFGPPPGLSRKQGATFPADAPLAACPVDVVLSKAPKATAPFECATQDYDDSTDAGSSQG
eukprot:TRINITY_DN77727_c0_g1_i1.p1 TRINITY_DN77727_c0_g1~~TRINITY_DN77727_c0_g1_i1.p1  ORF type:complete len:203 (+),score=33.48 TRINITY_DN77727_c0_g1_i1:43-609(+)